MDPILNKNFNEAIIFTKLLDNNALVAANSNTEIRFLNKETLEVLYSFKANIQHKRYKNNVVAFSDNGDNFASVSSDCKESILYDTKTKQALLSVNRHQGDVSCVAIDPIGRYMFSCGDDGKTFVVDIESAELSFTLPIHKDVVYDIAFSDNAQWVATASHDKTISLFNLPMKKAKHKLIAHSEPVEKLCFLSDHRLFSIDKSNSAIIWDMYKAKVITRLEGIHDDVTRVVIGSEDKFLFLGTKLGYIIVYDLENYKLISNKYIKLKSSISSIEFDENRQTLIIGSDTGDLLIYAIYDGEGNINELLKKKDFIGIEEYITLNPLLEYTKVYKVVSVIWDKTLNQAKEFLKNGDKSSAVKLLLGFKNIPSKNKIIQDMFQEYNEIDKLNELVKHGKISLAYSLVNANPSYEDTKTYKALEEKWKKIFALAKKYSLDLKGKDKLLELLAPYRGVSVKTKDIQELITQNEVYTRFMASVAKKEYVILSELIKQNPFLKGLPEYDDLIYDFDSMFIESQKLINNGDTQAAIKILRTLVNFSDFEEEAKLTIMSIEHKQKFYNALKDGDLIQAYLHLDSSSELKESEDGKRLQKQFEDDWNKAKTYASSGDIKGIKNTLNKYMEISSKNISLAKIFAFCYIVQLKEALKNKEDKIIIENGIKNYIMYFGLKKQIVKFFEIFKKYHKDSKLSLELQTKGSVDVWKPSMIVDSILD